MKLSVAQTLTLIGALAALAATATVSYQLGRLHSRPNERPVTDSSTANTLERDVVEHLASAARQQEIVTKLRNSGYHITYDYLATPSSDPVPAVKRLVSRFGPDFVGKPFYIGNSGAATNVELELLPLLPSLQNVDFDDSGITDDDLLHLKGMPNLRVLFLNGTTIGSKGLSHLVDTPIEILYLKDCPVDDSCVPYLSRMKSLKKLYMYGQISSSAIRQLEMALPNCDVE